MGGPLSEGTSDHNNRLAYNIYFFNLCLCPSKNVHSNTTTMFTGNIEHIMTAINLTNEIKAAFVYFGVHSSYLIHVIPSLSNKAQDIQNIERSFSALY